MKLKLILLCGIMMNVESARILGVFPTPSISHQVVFRSLTLELARRGYEVVVITTDPAFPERKTLENYTEINVHNVSYPIWHKILKQIGGRPNDWVEQIDGFENALRNIFEEQMKSKHVQSLLSHKKDYFDLLLLESSVKTALGFSHIFKVPVIQLSSLGSLLDNHYVMGSPLHPILYPTIFKRKTYNLTAWEKIQDFINDFKYELLNKKNEMKDNNVLKKIFGQNIPPLHELNNNVEMLFINAHPMWENNRPVPPGIIYIGGIHQNPQKELPEDLKLYLDSCKNGVIYFSMGTNIKTSNIPPEKLQVFIKVFSRLPYDVLWKWDDNQLPGQSKNIKISKWLPQSDLLRHPNIKLFITQGGIQSTDEAITAGVPLIGIPMLVDQWYNVERYVKFKIGVKLDFEAVTEITFENNIKMVLSDPSYRDNIVRLRNIMRDQPQRPLERAVWWVEYVLRHGEARHLRSPAANMSWAEYLELELVLTLSITLLISLAALCVIFKRIWNIFYFCFCKEKQS